jgi:hypothetical protein
MFLRVTGGSQGIRFYHGMSVSGGLPSWGFRRIRGISSVMQLPPPGTTVDTGWVSKSLLWAKSSQKVADFSYNKVLKKLLNLYVPQKMI